MAIGALVAARYPLVGLDRERLVGYLAGRTEGNAFFLGELLRTLQGEGLLYQDDTGWTLGDLERAPLPVLLRQVIDVRLGRLDGASQHLLAVAAVIGHEVRLDVWALVAEVDEDTVLTVAERGLESRLLRAASVDDAVRFAHALIRETLYNGMVGGRRRRLHLRIGETLAARMNPDPDAIAYHLRRAGDARAVTWQVRAGERAARAYAWRTAADRFAAALELADGDGADPGGRGWLLYHVATLRALADTDSFVARLDEAERLARASGDRGLAALAVFWRGTLRCIIGDRREGLSDMEAGVRARRALTPAERAALPALPVPHTVRDDTDGEPLLVQWLATVGRYAQARAIGERSLTEATQRRDAPFVGDAYLGLAQVYAGLGLAAESRIAFARARRDYRAIGHQFMAGISASNELRWVFPYIADDPVAVAALLDEMDAAMAGSGESPSEYLRRYPRMIRQLLGDEWRAGRVQADAPGGTFGFRQTASQLLAPILRAQGDRDAAWALVRAVLPEGAATEPGDTWFPCGLTCLRLGAALALDADNPDTARDWLEAHDRWVAWSASPFGRADGHLGWAAWYRAAGTAAAAQQHATAALTQAAAPRQPLALLAAHRILGELAIAAGRFPAAAHHLDAALVLADACAAPYERALTLLALAELRLAGADNAGVHAALHASRALLDPLEARLALAHASTLTARCDAPSTATPATLPNRLSRREVAVLGLLAAGRSNQAIAQALYLSPRTVQRHVANVYLKIGAHNRAEATAYALRHGLR